MEQKMLLEQNYGIEMQCVALYGRVWPKMAVYGRVWPCMAVYGRVWPCMAMYGRVWPCMMFINLEWGLVALYGFSICSIVALYRLFIWSFLFKFEKSNINAVADKKIVFN